MIDALKWWLAVQVLALAAMPLCLALFNPLADRGHGLSKAFGLLLFGYAVWLLGVLQLLPNGPFAYGAALLLILGGSFLALHRAGNMGTARGDWIAGLHDILEFWRRRRGLLLIQEALFLATFLGFLWIRSYNADISGTEKFMDFAFMNAVTRSPTFPPLDPWLAPGPDHPHPTINYYHFGYLLQGLLLTLTGVAPAVGYNLALSMLFALAAVTIFSLTYGLARDLVAERARRPSPAARSAPSAITSRTPSWSFRAARPYLVVGLLGAFLLLVSGNLWTFLRRLDGSGTWEKDFWGGVGWNATRVLVIKNGEQDLDYTINEFPAFSFLLGDLHPHVLALPFAVLAVAMAYTWLMRPPLLYRWAVSGEPLPNARARWRRFSPYAELLPGALLLGSLYFLNSWDFPAYFMLAQAGALAGAYWVSQSAVSAESPLGPGEAEADDEDDSTPATRHSPFLRSVVPIALTGLLALLLFLPFHLTFRPPVVSDAASPLPLGLVAQRSFLSQFTQFWGIQLLLLAPALGAALAFGGALRWAPRFSGSLRRAQTVAIIAREPAGWEPALLLGAAVLALALADRLGSGALALAMAGAAAYAARRALEMPEPGMPAGPLAGRRPLAFAFGLVCLAALLLAACEVVYIRDFYGGALRRMNTVFKLYYQAWLLFAAGGSLVSFWLYRTLRARRVLPGGTPQYAAFLGLGALLLVAALHFPVKVTLLRTNSFQNPSTLNGMEWMRRFHADDYAAAEWLRQDGATAAQPAPVVLEATGGAYSEFARMATQTGFPTVLGWDQHERLWRGAAINPEVDRRKADVDAIYTAPTLDAAKPLLDKYGVTYIVVGYLEQQKHGATGGLAKFDAAARAGQLQTAFQQGQTAIYRLPR